jgi:hypothetical protein
MVDDIDTIEDLKQRARRLHKRARAGEDDALAFLRRFAPDARGAANDELQRRHALAALAVALGFHGWPHALAVLGGDRTGDLGKLLFRDTGGGMWNVWSASYDEARDIRAEHGGFLLPYGRQFVIVEEPFLEWLELDPSDGDWDRIGRDWVRPRDEPAWRRVTAAAVAARLARVTRELEERRAA